MAPASVSKTALAMVGCSALGKVKVSLIDCRSWDVEIANEALSC